MDEDFKNKLKEKIRVMQACLDGKKIKVQLRFIKNSWCVVDNPVFDWNAHDYRVAVTKPSINWDHVSPDYNYLATNQWGQSYLYNKKPLLDEMGWGFREGESTIYIISARGFTSFVDGDCDWCDSLIERPNLNN